ncbi:MAG: DUF4388 domain-containing protein [Nitrospirota bacterium]
MDNHLFPGEKIEGVTIPRLFQKLYSEKKTGVLAFERNQILKHIFFYAGYIVYATSNQKEDSLGKRLLKAGIITQQQADAISELYEKTHKAEGISLVDLGFITPRELAIEVKNQVKQIIISLFNWQEGRYWFEEGEQSPAYSIPLQISIGNLIIEGLQEIEWKIVRKWIPPLQTVFRPTNDPSFLFQGAELTPDQQAVLLLIDGTNTIEKICSLSGIGDYNTLKALYVLRALQMVEQGAIQTEEEKIFARDVVQNVVSSSSRAVESQETAGITREELHAAYKKLRAQTHYEVLGVGREDTAPAIKKAYFSLAKLYHPDRHFFTDMGDMKEKLEALFHAIHDAYETLADRTKRAEYDRQLSQKSKQQPDAEEEAHPEPLSNKEIAALQFERGIEEFRNGNFWGADEAFQWALRLEPDNARFIFHRGLTLSRIPRRGHEAEEYFAKAIRLAPSNPNYFLEFGNFCLRSGLKKKALHIWKAGLKRNPDFKDIKQAIKENSG